MPTPNTSVSLFAGRISDALMLLIPQMASSYIHNDFANAGVLIWGNGLTSFPIYLSGAFLKAVTTLASTYSDEIEELGSASHDLSLVLLRQTPSCSAALFSKVPYLLCYYVRLYPVFLCHFVPLAVLCDRLMERIQGSISDIENHTLLAFTLQWKHMSQGLTDCRYLILEVTSATDIDSYRHLSYIRVSLLGCMSLWT